MHERTVLRNVRDFIHSNENCFLRNCLKGHITGSAFILNYDLKSCLLVFHQSLAKWIQVGGHSEEAEEAHESAFREATEESGISQLKYFNMNRLAKELGPCPTPFDIDIHTIPKRAEIPQHLHFDIRYLLYEERPSLRSAYNGEGQKLLWCTLEKIRNITGERSVHRQADKAIVLGTLVGREEISTWSDGSR